MKQCPHCSQLILDVASRCRFCGKDMPDQDPAEQDWEPFIRRYTSGYAETQMQLWGELTQEQQEYLVAELGISPPQKRHLRRSLSFHNLVQPRNGITSRIISTKDPGTSCYNAEHTFNQGD